MTVKVARETGTPPGVGMDTGASIQVRAAHRAQRTISFVFNYEDSFPNCQPYSDNDVNNQKEICQSFFSGPAGLNRYCRAWRPFV